MFLKRIVVQYLQIEPIFSASNSSHYSSRAYAMNGGKRNKFGEKSRKMKKYYLVVLRLYYRSAKINNDDPHHAWI